MIGLPYMRSWFSGSIRLGWRDDRAAQLVEFAVALPLLVVFVVGIFDFSSAFTLKQKLTNAARDAARTAAADPASDLGNGFSMSVNDAFQVVDKYLLANQINDCGIAAPTGPPIGLTWTVTGTATGCSLTITIDRGYYFPASATAPAGVTCQPQPPNGSQTMVIATCVSIQYAYPWRFGHVASLLGTTATLPPRITATAVALNEN